MTERMAPSTPPLTLADVPEPLPLSAYANMAIVLRAGLLLAVGLFASGLVLFFVRHPAEDLTRLESVNYFVRYLDPRILFPALAAARPGALLTLGILVLVATPMARVLTGVYYFHQHGEREMTIVTATVLAMLLLGTLVLGSYLAHL
ncbi:MAG: DUF1634 domain-containing protein [Thermoplasmata archaeon]